MSAALPLSKFVRFATDSVDYVRAAMTQAYCSHGITLDERKPQLLARHHQVELNAISFNYLTYGAALTVHARELPDFFLVDFPIAGCAHYRVDAHEFTCREGKGCIVSAGRGVQATWSPDCQIITLKLRRIALERYLGELLECPVTRPLRFEPELDCKSGAGASLRSLVDHLVYEFDHADAVRQAPLWSRQIERLVACALLSTQRHNYSDALEARYNSISPGYVRRAQAFIRANLAGGTLDMRKIAAAAGVPERTLFAAYRKYVGLSPIAHYRALRLQCARDDLTDPKENDTVASIACRWGFYHLGHFSRDYARRYGEKPSDTLRRNG